jgi:peptide-methionine (S)-S-oxide reductase
MEPPFDKLDGVMSTTSGYTGGELSNPTYEQVSAGGTGHYEAVKVVYDDSKVSYGALLNVFWRNIDPFDGGGQFCDRGSQYESAIFVENDRQRRLAEASKRKLQKRNDDSSVQTRVLQASAFYPAEEYHQDYYSKNPLRYRFYRLTCGRDARLSEVWGDSPDELHLAPVSSEN